MGFLRRLDGADDFLRSGAHLGVTDVRVAGTADCVYVFVNSGRTENELTIVRILATKHWPGREIVIAIRRPGDSGEVRVASYATAEAEEPPSNSNVG